MERLTKNRTNKKRYILIAIVLVALIAFFVVFPVSAAEDKNSIPFEDKIKKISLTIFAIIIYKIASVLGWIFTHIVAWIAAVASWNHFIDIPTVIQGWVIVRDLSNMFFILVLLVIAFATILRVENYSARRLLPKLLLMALLINFSRTICGLIIDASQVVMLTFVAGFSNKGVNKLVDLLGLKAMLEMSKNESSVVNLRGIFAGTVVAFFVALAAVIVSIVLLAILVFRVIMLWLYVILSPLAFLLSTFPAGARYASMWWQEFTKQVIIGPVLAFFLWLALATAQSSADSFLRQQRLTFKSSIPTDFFDASNFQTYIITLGLLIGGLITAQQLGGAAGRIAGRGMGTFKKTADAALGARYVRERWGAFQSQRESARKAKANLAGQRLYGTYAGIKTGGKALLAGSYEASLGKLVTPLKSRVSDRTIGAFKSWLDRRKQASQHLEEAFEGLENTSDNGTILERDGFSYVRRGNSVEVLDRNGRRVLFRGPTGMDFARAFKRSYSSAALVKDKIVKENVSKTKERFANFSLADLRNVLSAATSSQTERLTAAMMLAQKEGFRNANEFFQAKQAVSNFPSLAKEFNKEADKRYGYWNSMYQDTDGNLRVDANTLANKIADGTIEVSKLDTSQLDRQAIDVIANIRDVEFADDLKNMARTNRDRERLREILAQDIDRRGFSGTDLDIRKAYAFQMGGNIEDAFRDASGRVNRQQRIEALRNAKAEHLARIRREDIEQDAEFQEDFVRATSLSQLKALERSGKSPDKLRRYLSIIRQRAAQLGRQDLIEEITQDNTLNSIYRDV